MKMPKIEKEKSRALKVVLIFAAKNEWKKKVLK